MIMKIYRSLIRAEEGVTAIEYGLIAAMVGVVIIVSINSLGSVLTITFQESASVMDPVALATVTDTDKGKDKGKDKDDD